MLPGFITRQRTERFVIVTSQTNVLVPEAMSFRLETGTNAMKTLMVSGWIENSRVRVGQASIPSDCYEVSLMEPDFLSVVSCKNRENL